MKLIHTSDIHLDSPLTSGLTREKGQIRRRELLSGFSLLVEKATELSASAIIIAGDLFDFEDISKKTLDTVLFVISNSPKISFFYLPGNHEKQALLSSGRTLPNNLFVFDEDWTYFRAGNLVIAGRSKITSDMFDTLSLNTNDKNILVLHGEPADKTAAPHSIGIREAIGKNIDYIALGHYHTARSYSLGSRGSAVYCGAPMARGFDECGDRGCMLIDSENPSDFKFIPLEGRCCNIATLDVTDITDYGVLENACRKALVGFSFKDIVRLELVGKKSPTLWIDTKEIESLFEERFFHFEVQNSTKLSINKDSFLTDKTLKGEFVRLVYSKEELDEETKEKIIETGLFALMGE